MIHPRAHRGKDVWISTDSNVLPDLYRNNRTSRLILGGVWKMKMTPNKIIAVFLAKDSMLSDLSRIIHKERHYLGGYVVHSSLEEAKNFIKKLDNAIQNPVTRNYTIDNTVVAEQIYQKIIPDNLEQIVRILSRKFVNRHHKSNSGIEASNWIRKRWKTIALARDDITVTPFIHKETRQRSQIATIKGIGQGTEIVVIGAHLDSINSRSPDRPKIEDSTAPGADDNASGIAILTELLRLIVETGYRPEKTVQLMGFAAEEVGLVGSEEIAARYKSNGENVVGMLNLDMSGYRGGPKDIYILTDNTNPAQNVFVSDLIKKYFMGSSTTFGYTECSYACSDHATWTAEGFPASLIFESSLKNINPNMHSINDDVVDKDHMKKFAKLTAVYMAELAKGKTGKTKPEGSNSYEIKYQPMITIKQIK